MSKTKSLGIVSVGLAAAFATAWTGAEPILPTSPPPPEEALSLAGVRRFQIAPITLTPMLERAEVNARVLQKQIGLRLRREGFEVADDPALPRIGLTILTDTDPDHPQAVALTIIISAHQRVRVDRIGRSLTVPTATTGNTVLTTTANLSTAVERGIHHSLGTLLDYISWASRESSDR